jgi:hypothetical protein
MKRASDKALDRLQAVARALVDTGWPGGSGEPPTQATSI